MYLGTQVWTEDDANQPQHHATSATPPSPAAAAELAALRRAHVFGNTVGADVSVSFRAGQRTTFDIAQQRRAWAQVPALRVAGVDDCAAVAEYYANTHGQVAGPSTGTCWRCSGRKQRSTAGTPTSAAAICNAVASPIVSTSANVAGMPVARNRYVLRKQFGDAVDYIVPGDCGPATGPSEIRDLATGTVIRPRAS